MNNSHRNCHVGSSNYSEMSIQPWDVWKAWNLNPWDADIVKRVARTKQIPGMHPTLARIEDYQKIKHICDEMIAQLEASLKTKQGLSNELDK